MHIAPSGFRKDGSFVVPEFVDPVTGAAESIVARFGTQAVEPQALAQ